MSNWISAYSQVYSEPRKNHPSTRLLKNDVLRFVQLDRESKSFLNRDDLLAIPEFAVNPLAERIVDLFMPVEKESKCNFAEFCFMLAHFQPTNEDTPDEMPNSGLVSI